MSWSSESHSAVLRAYLLSGHQTRSSTFAAQRLSACLSSSTTCLRFLLTTSVLLCCSACITRKESKVPSDRVAISGGTNDRNPLCTWRVEIAVRAPCHRRPDSLPTTAVIRLEDQKLPSCSRAALPVVASCKSYDIRSTRDAIGGTAAEDDASTIILKGDAEKGLNARWQRAMTL
jgi:hypothetical protein